MTDNEIVIAGVNKGRAYHEIGNVHLPEHISMQNGMPHRAYWRIPKSLAEELGFDPCCWCGLHLKEHEESHVEADNPDLNASL
jgi:hypothetical protein